MSSIAYSSFAQDFKTLEDCLRTSNPINFAESSLNNILKKGHLATYKNGLKIGPLHNTKEKAPYEVRISSKELDNLLLFTRKTDAIRSKIFKERIKKEVSSGNSIPNILGKYSLTKKPVTGDQKFLLNNAIFNTFYEKVFVNAYKERKSIKAMAKGKSTVDSLASTCEGSVWMHPDSLRYNSKMNFPSGKTFYRNKGERLPSAKSKISSPPRTFGDEEIKLCSNVDKPISAKRPLSCGRFSYRPDSSLRNPMSLPPLDEDKTIYKGNDHSVIKIGNFLKSLEKQAESADYRIPTAKTMVNPLDSIEN